MTPLKTPDQVRAALSDAGISVAEWCRVNHFNRMTVVDLLLGRQKGIRGESHRAAVALGLKHGHVVKVTEFMPAPPKPKSERRTAAKADRRSHDVRRDSAQPDRRARKAA